MFEVLLGDFMLLESRVTSVLQPVQHPEYDLVVEFGAIRVLHIQRLNEHDQYLRERHTSRKTIGLVIKR